MGRPAILWIGRNLCHLRGSDARTQPSNTTLGLSMHQRGAKTQVTVFEAGMAPQIGGSIVAIQYGLDPRLISLMVGVGTVLSFVTLPALWWVSAHL